MKISHYIILSFFFCLFGGIFILFLTSKLYHHTHKQEVILKEKPVERFSVVVAESKADICIAYGVEPKIGMYLMRGDTCRFPEFMVRNDTLFVGANPPENKSSTNIFCTRINSIEGKGQSKVRLEQPLSDSLFVKLTNAQFECYPAQNSANFSLRIIASHSYVSISSANISNFNFEFTNTRMDAWQNHIQKISGKLKDKSNISLGKIDKVNRMEADETSEYRLEK